LAVLSTIILSTHLLAESQDERIWLDGKINGKTARLCFDSGADNLILFRQGAQRLGLKINEAATSTVSALGQVPRGFTEECSFKLGPTTGRVRFDVVDMTSGLFNWPGILHRANATLCPAANGLCHIQRGRAYCRARHDPPP
jgi:hypothetical protein